MSRVPACVPVLLLACVAVAACPAQELIRLKSGEAHQGTLKRGAELSTIQTAVGWFSVATKDVAGSGPARAGIDAVAAAADGIQSGDVGGLVAAARFAASRGIWTEARRLLDRALAINAEDKAALAVADAWALRFRIAEGEDARDAAGHKSIESWLEAPTDWVGAAMGAAKCRAVGGGAVLYPAVKAMRSQSTFARWTGARALASLTNQPPSIKPLWKRSLIDRDAAVRHVCVSALRDTNDPVFAHLYALSLNHAQGTVRVAAEEALGALGMKEGIEPLLSALAGSGGVPTHQHIAILTQRAYVKDFDVQIARGAVIADPIVDIVQDGTVLDVGIVSVNVERTVIMTALQRITGKNFGTDAAAWRTGLGLK